MLPSSAPRGRSSYAGTVAPSWYLCVCCCAASFATSVAVKFEPDRVLVWPTLFDPLCDSGRRESTSGCVRRCAICQSRYRSGWPDRWCSVEHVDARSMLLDGPCPAAVDRCFSQCWSPRPAAAPKARGWRLDRAKSAIVRCHSGSFPT